MMMPWAEIHVGDYILLDGQIGPIWKIQDERDGWLRLVERGGTHWDIRRPRPDAPVNLVWRRPDEIEAVQAVQTVMGAVIIEHKNELGPMRVLAFDDMPMSDQRRHLWVAHGVAQNTLLVVSQMDELHDAAHEHAAHPSAPHQVPHVHVGAGERIVIV